MATPCHLVVGGGPVGLLVCELLLSVGEQVLAVEENDLRRSVMDERKLSVAPSLAAVNGSFTTVIDCAGSAEIVPSALALLRPHGLYLIVGYSRVPDLDLSVISRREACLKRCTFW